jgi:hypothetical protein
MKEDAPIKKLEQNKYFEYSYGRGKENASIL